MRRMDRREGAWARQVMSFMLPLWIALGHDSFAHAADSGRIEKLLRVQSGATCLRRETLAPEVERWLYDARIPDDLRIEVTGSASDPRSVRLRVIRREGIVAHRAFEPGPERCSSLQAAVALAVALTIKASLVDELGRPLPDDPAARTHGWSLAGSALLAYRLLPELAPGVELSVRRAFGEYVALRIGALGVTAFGVELAQNAGTFNATLVAARADACARARLARILRGGLCLGGLGGVLYAAGADVTSPTRSVVGVFALTNALDLELELSRHWSLALGLSLTFLLHRVGIGIEDTRGMRVQSRALHSPGFALGLGPAYSF